MKPSEIQSIVDNAVLCFLESDSYLLEQDSHEQNITSTFARYLHDQIPAWTVDCEYNRFGRRIKRLRLSRDREEIYGVEKDVRVRPDIIVHHRGKEYDNLLVIEAKKSSSQEPDDFDLHKLEKFIEQLKYRYAFFLKFIVGDKPDVEIQWVKV